MDIAADVLAGKAAAGARAIRWLDDRDPRGLHVLRHIFPHTGRAHIIGVTGPPGAGKSTLVDMLIAEQRRRDRKVAVIAVDPSSPFSGGAILGDRVRMNRHALDEGVFVRSMGTRGQAGGLSRATYDAALVFDAMGYDVVIVETVGVGQDEIDIVSLAHTTVIVSVPGLGDEVQAVKAGLLEAGDVFVINKADRDGAEQTQRQLELMLHLRAVRDWSPPLIMAVAAKDQGGVEISDALDAHLAHLRASGGFERQTAVRDHHQFVTLVREQVASRLLAASGGLSDDVRTRRLDPYSAAQALISHVEVR
jgi:LAO/AO transport system kinase